MPLEGSKSLCLWTLVSPAHPRVRTHYTFMHPFIRLVKEQAICEALGHNSTLRNEGGKPPKACFLSTQVVQALIYKYRWQLGFVGLVHCVSGTVPSTLQTSSPLIQQPHVIYIFTPTGEMGETEAQECGAIYPKSHSEYMESKLIQTKISLYVDHLGFLFKCLCTLQRLVTALILFDFSRNPME